MAKLWSAAVVAVVTLTLIGCVTRPPLVGRFVKGVPQPGRWKEFLLKAERGQVDEVRDELAEPPVEFGAGGPTTAPEIFKGKFRPEAKTSYVRGHKEKLTDLQSVLKPLPTDAQMTLSHHELIAKDSNHQNHVPRVPEEMRNVTVNAWLYWLSRQSDDDYHLILGDTSELSSETVFMNAEISGLPPDKPTRQPFVRLRDNLRTFLASVPNKNGAFVDPVPVRITGSLLWDGEHRHPHNVGPTKPVDMRPEKAWEIHPVRAFVH